jgi:hypothetical protein
VGGDGGDATSLGVGGDGGYSGVGGQVFVYDVTAGTLTDTYGGSAVAGGPGVGNVGGVGGVGGLCEVTL